MNNIYILIVSNKIKKMDYEYDNPFNSHVLEPVSGYTSSLEDIPMGPFYTREIFEYDYQVHTWKDVFDQIKNNKGALLKFQAHTEKSYGYGPGANKHIYHLILSNLMCDKLLYHTNTYHVKPNLENEFWEHEQNIDTFVRFIGMCMVSDCKIPYHFHPSILESITCQKYSDSDLIKILSKTDPITAKQLINISKDEFIELGLDFDSKEAYLRSIIIGDLNCEEILLHQFLAQSFDSFDVKKLSPSELDYKLSGDYHLTPEMVLSNMIITDSEYEEQWSSFVKSLNETELKKLLITINGCLDSDVTIRVDVVPYGDLDIRVSTCSNGLTLHQRIFETDSLDLVKQYLITGNHDVVADSPKMRSFTETLRSYEEIESTSGSDSPPLSSEPTYTQTSSESSSYSGIDERHIRGALFYLLIGTINIYRHQIISSFNVETMDRPISNYFVNRQPILHENHGTLLQLAIARSPNAYIHESPEPVMELSASSRIIQVNAEYKRHKRERNKIQRSERKNANQKNHSKSMRRQNKLAQKYAPRKLGKHACYHY